MQPDCASVTLAPWQRQEGWGGGAGREDEKQASCQVDGDRSAVEKRSLEMAKEVCK